jgi:hypothetical protein
VSCVWVFGVWVRGGYRDLSAVGSLPAAPCFCKGRPARTRIRHRPSKKPLRGKKFPEDWVGQTLQGKTGGFRRKSDE